MSNTEGLKAGGALASAFSLSSPARSTVAQVLVSLGIKPADAGYSEDVLRTGCTLVTVHSENGIVDALKILERRGAVARLEDCK
jgi:hypothetical protein